MIIIFFMVIVHLGKSKSMTRFKIKIESERNVLETAKEKFNGPNTDFCSKILGRHFVSSGNAGGYLNRIGSGYTCLTLDQWENLKNYANGSE